MRPNTRNLLPITFAWLILFTGFAWNTWHTVDQADFSTFQRDSDALVYGGLGHCISAGTAHFGLWITAKDLQAAASDNEWVDSTRDAWLKPPARGLWIPYQSQIGLHAWLDCGIYKLIPRISHTKLISIIILFNAAMLAACACAIIGWCNTLGERIGWIIPAMVIAACPALTQIGKSLYWISWTWFIPMAASICATKYVFSSNRARNNVIIFSLIFITVFFKSACGYEYISFVLTIIMLPFIATVFDRPRDVKVFVDNLLLPSIAGITGFAVAITTHALLRSHNFDLFNGLSEIVYDAARRTYGTSDSLTSLPAVVQNSLKVPVSAVLYLYFYMPVISLPGGVDIEPVQILVSVAAATLIAISLDVFGRGGWKRNLALRSITLRVFSIFLIGLCGPLSWFALAKGHSYIHQPINVTLWVLPMVPLALVALATAIARIPMVSLLTPFEKGTIALLALLFLSSSSSDISLHFALKRAIRDGYVFQQGNILSFKKGSDVLFVVRPQTPVEPQTKFFVHIYPTRLADLPEQEQSIGFDNLDFEPELQRMRIPSWSWYSNFQIFYRRIPDIYTPDRIAVGQYRSGNGQEIWSGEIHDFR